MGAFQPPPRKPAGIKFPPGMTPALQDEPMHFEPGVPPDAPLLVEHRAKAA